jgi:hypothetical protein
MKKIVAFIAAIMMIAMGSSIAYAATPIFDQNQDMDATIFNTPPYIIGGYIEILNQDGIPVWTSDPVASGFTPTRADSYSWESEKLIVYCWIHDDNGESDLWQHTAEAWLSPIGAFISDLAIVEFTHPDGTEALFKGEKLIPGPDIWHCEHDVYITDVDKYGASATNEPFEIFFPLFINPLMSSTFVPEFVAWGSLLAGDVNILADSNTHIEHVYAECDGVPVTVNFELKIHGTDLEGGIGTSHVIPCENVEYSQDGGITWVALTNGEVSLGEYVTSQDIPFDFRISVPWIEPGDYYGEVGFGIFAL